MSAGVTSADSAVSRNGATSTAVNVAVGAILIAHFALANAATWNKSATFDEVAHIASGHSSWATGDHRMYPVAVLQHRWMTLPVYLANYEAPKPEGPMWDQADNWTYGRELLFGPKDPEHPEQGTKNDPQEVLHVARMMTSIWSVLCGWIVFVWSRRLWGTAGGFISLLLYAFNPNILAHASSATIDLPAALAFTAGMFTLWNLLQNVTTKGLVISSVVWGMALASKFSALLLVPLGLALMLLRYLDGRPLSVKLPGYEAEITERNRLLPLFGIIVLAHFVATWITIWALFDFRFSTFVGEPAVGRYANDRPVEPQFEAWMSHPNVRNSSTAPIIRLFHTLRIFPETYLTCFLNTTSTVAGFNAFLNGRFGQYGFYSFFPYCVLFKTPFAVFLIFAAAVGAHFVRRFHQIKRLQRRPMELFKSGFYVTAPLWATIVLYWFTAITGNINIGIRHVLPTFPAIFILMGAAGAWLGGRGSWFGADDNSELIRTDDGPDEGEPFRTVVTAPIRLIAKWFTAICVSWFVLDVATAFPNYLAYFNFIGGGTNGGYRHLVDSSYDWGQELPALAEWLEKHELADEKTRKRRVYFSYFGTSRPSAYGIRATMLPCFFSADQIDPYLMQHSELLLQPGVYVISATMLQSVYNDGVPGPWREDYERYFQELRKTMEGFLAMPEGPEKAQMQQQYGEQRLQQEIELFRWLQLGRLCNYLRRHPPDAQINGGLLVYSLNEAELRAAIYSTEKPPDTYKPPLKPGDNVPY